MKILCDKKGKEAILQLCDVALKTGGLRNMQRISEILKSIENVEHKKQEE